MFSASEREYMNSSNNTQQTVVSVFKIAGLLLKILFTGPLGIMFLLATGLIAYQQLRQISRFIEYRVFPAHYIVGKICLVIFALSFSLVFLRLTFNKKLAKISYKTILITMALSVLVTAVCEMVDDVYTNDFRYYSYPPYILDWPTQSVSDTISCDYSQDTIFLRGDFNVTGNSFRRRECLEFIQTPQLTDSYKVEIHYKGKTAEIYLGHNDWEMEEYGNYQDNINIWPQDYDYEVPPQDIAYMYKHGVNLEYSEPLVVEKIIIYTAYPEKFDTSDMWFNS